MTVGPAWSSPTKFTRHRGLGPLQLLLKIQLCRRRRPETSAFDRPVDTGVTRLEEQALPVGVVGPAARPVVGRRLGWQSGQDTDQPIPETGPELLLASV